jgi:hypothetical protein
MACCERRTFSALFADFERLLPSCLECYVPALGPQGQVPPFSLTQPQPQSIPRIGRQELKERLDRGEPMTLLDVRQKAQVDLDPRALPGARWLSPDEAARRGEELPRDREAIAYCT